MLQARRRQTNLLQRLTGIEAKLDQYAAGERFIAAIEAEGGPRAVDRCWAGPDALPTMEEIRDPQRWIDRSVAMTPITLIVDADRPALVDELLTRCELPELPERRRQPAVTCAVSGGADSLALLVLVRAAGFEATAVHVDHGLRAGSAAEADVVAAAAARFGAGFRAERVVIEPGPNLEARARAARYAVLPAGVLTGHTADDQAETVLLNLLRGSGLDGLAGMRAVPAGTGPRRPLLAIRRAETVALCTAFGLQPVADPSNADPAHRRNRIRHELLPLAAAIAERDVAALLARQADPAARRGRPARPAGGRDRPDRQPLARRRAAGVGPAGGATLAGHGVPRRPPARRGNRRARARSRPQRAPRLRSDRRLAGRTPPRKAVDHRPGALMDGVGVL